MRLDNRIARLKCVTFGAPVMGNAALAADLRMLVKDFAIEGNVLAHPIVHIMQHVRELRLFPIFR